MSADRGDREVKRYIYIQLHIYIYGSVPLIGVLLIVLIIIILLIVLLIGWSPPGELP